MPLFASSKPLPFHVGLDRIVKRRIHCTMFIFSTTVVSACTYLCRRTTIHLNRLLINLYNSVEDDMMERERGITGIASRFLPKTPEVLNIYIHLSGYVFRKGANRCSPRLCSKISGSKGIQNVLFLIIASSLSRHLTSRSPGRYCCYQSWPYT
ncbi:hypothetical protein F4810DRAFT_328298 [Camillea tinctor]|nr:hypothetical protein F4810DRAFT_328298 [Camillea tinctor]